MSSQLSLTHKWLRDNVASYPAPDRLFADIDAALARFPALRPKSDVYTYDDGRTQLLLCVHGLLPISFRAASYNIPIAVWLTRDYPREPPLPYVVPTADMLVKPGPHLDVSGRSTLDFVRQWQRKSEGCSLAGLLDAMQAEFSRVPPVYAKPSQPPRPPQSPQPSRSQPSQQPPTLPPKPPTPHYNNATPRPPPPPPHPRVDPGPPQYRPAPAPPHYQAPPVPWSPPRDPRVAPAPNPPAPPQPPNLLDAEQPVLYAPQAVQAAPAPPRPPNPELLRLHDAVHAKLSSELASLGHALALDAERLRAHQADLLAGEPAIRDEMARLEAVRDVCRTAAGRMRGAVESGERNVADLRAKSTPEVDELVCSTTIVHNQLINLVAEDNAIEDTIYHLSKALNSGRIDLDRFLRSCRLLAEEQFMKRALIEKIQTGIPMGQLAGY
ncbi:UEV-domain-containing protein [Mycena belliarum]|uniref:UEV-domain-containing protein n=1 Tax=Mycena belliarum TaxID=1033014 RepID=A0AAD6UG56_9AGAR|nr:UEV-domain-containing protein [Mycena belliae]